MKKFKNLVVARCGDNSLHPEWLLGNLKFDIVLSYFGDDIKYDLSKVKYIHYYKGSKWQGLFNSFDSHKDFWADYDYIWLPDDDLSTTTENINNFFELIHQYDFSLSQPALTHNSYYSHSVLLQVKGGIYCKTNFVEVMAPCFNRTAFLKCWETFRENKSGWGLDLYWPKILKNQNIGVIDAATIFHTRPVGIADHGTGTNQVSPEHECIILCRKHKLQMKQGCYSILTEEKEYLTKKQDILNAVVKGCSPARLQEKTSLYNEVMYPDKVL